MTLMCMYANHVFKAGDFSCFDLCDILNSGISN
jgi:hypothetical protein